MRSRQLRLALNATQTQQEYDEVLRKYYAEEDARLEAYHRQSERFSALVWLLLMLSVFLVTYACAS